VRAVPDREQQGFAVSRTLEMMAMPDEGDEATESSKADRAAGVGRMLSGDAPPEEPPGNDPEPPGEVGGASTVGESTTDRAEDVADDKEPGRVDTGTEGGADRPTGVSTGRDSTSTDVEETSTEGPELPSGDGGG
jgi:hypothetical protein